MDSKVFYYVDRDDDSSVAKFDFGTNTGYVWNYKKKKWVEYPPIEEEVHKGELHVIKEETANGLIKKAEKKFGIK